MTGSCGKLIEVLGNRESHEEREAHNEDVTGEIHVCKLKLGDTSAHCKIKQETRSNEKDSRLIQNLVTTNRHTLKDRCAT